MLKINSVAAAFNISAASGNFCQLTCPLPLGSSGVVEGGADLFDSGYYIITTGVGVSAGSVSIAMLTWGGAWVTATTPNSTTGAAFTLIPTLAASTTYVGTLGVAGAIFFPCSGLRFVLAGLAGGNITLMQMSLTKR